MRTSRGVFNWVRCARNVWLEIISKQCEMFKITGVKKPNLYEAETNKQNLFFLNCKLLPTRIQINCFVIRVIALVVMEKLHY